MANITDIVDLVHPAANSTGTILSDQIWVIFDQEMDEVSLGNGNLIVTGPDTDIVIGPDMGINLPAISDSGSNDQLASPGYEGVVPGTITFQRINLLDTNLYTGAADTTAAGNLWRTKLIFTPDFSLTPETEYTIYMAGDENIPDALVTGIRSRTIFDPISLVGNTGTGSIDFYGSYSGTGNDVYHVKITTAGTSGVALFVWFKESNPSNISMPILSDRYNHQTLENGIAIKLLDGAFNLNDEFTVIVKTPTLFSGNTFWTFTSGSGSITSIPTTTATSIIGDSVQSSVFTTQGFSILSILPKDQATNLPVTTRRIVINFSGPIDPATINASTVQIEGRPVNGDENLVSTRLIYSDLTITGTKLIIDI